ncbi:242_t:CDS:2 [Cetraspora pellucida]|uniref:242_t:CDS:1 n=1 Tax=Cetraspora pellucida TaxID=1433469 RepID=A0A9N9JME6_9GLOM|nr:242_t:CDS:2 [Cetraspora pellucida]
MLIKKGLPTNEYLYKIPKPGKRFSYIVVVPEEIYENFLDRKKKSKKKKLKIAKNLLQSNDSQSLDENEIAKIKDKELQKLAKKWLKNYIKNLHNAPKKEEAIICHLWKDTTILQKKYLSDLLSKLSKLNIEYRNRLYKLIMQAQKYKTNITILEKYIFRYNLESECKVLIDFWNTWYKVTSLEIAHFQALSIMQNSKKDVLSKSEIDEIVDLYC